MEWKVTKKLLCMEFNETKANIAEVAVTGGKSKILKSFSMEIPTGVVNDGVLRKNVAFIEDLKKALADHEMKSKKVIFTIHSVKIASREIQIPLVKESHIVELLTTNIRDYFPVDIEDYQLGYQVLSKERHKNAGNMKVSVSLVPRDMIQGYLKLAMECGLSPVAIDSYGNSLAMSVLSEHKKGIHAYIRVEENKSFIMAYENNTILFQRMLPYGLNVDAGEEELNLLTDNVLNTFKYYTANFSDRPIEHIYVDDSDANPKSFAEVLSNFIEVPVEAYSGKEDAQQYMALLGSSLRPILRIGEKDKSAEEQLNVLDATRMARFVCSGCVIAAVVLVLVPFLYGTYLRSKTAYVEGQIDTYAKEEAIFANYEQTTVNCNDMKALYDCTISHNEELIAFMEEMEEKMPTDLRVISMTADDDKITLNLEVPSKEEAAAVLVQFRTFEEFATVSTDGLDDMLSEDGTHTITMNVVLTYEAQGGTENETVIEG